VFYVPESTFYFFDIVVGYYVLTTEEKVRLVLSQSLQNRAWGQGVGVAPTMLNEFRKKKVVDEIIAKAKALLAAEVGFFTGPEAQPRWGDEQRAKEANAVTGLTMDSTFADNGSAQQLSASQTLDDGTLLNLVAGSASWSVVAGQLPAGLYLNMATGVISGTPSGTGPYSFEIEVADNLGDAAESTGYRHSHTADVGSGSPHDDVVYYSGQEPFAFPD
jgi:hypothetical protein